MIDSVKRDVKRGAAVNVLGLIGKISGPAFLIMVTRLYGADTFGVFVSAVALVEMAIAFLTAGFKDAALIYVARHADKEDEHVLLYQAIANALVWSLVFSVPIVLVVLVLGPTFLPQMFEYGNRLVVPLQAMMIALPLMAFDRVVLAATQGLKIMKYEALVNGGLRPLILLASGAVIWLLDPTETGLALAYVVTQTVIALVAGYVYQRELEWKPLLQALRHFRLNREILAFALPQNLNTTFERFITNVDVLMLGFFGVSARTVGFYAAGALIVRELRQIKLIYTASFAPHIVRLYRQRDLAALGHLFSTVSTWISRLAIPAIIGVAVLRQDLVRLVSPEYSGEATLFMLLLLPIPYLQCSFGTAGNVVVMTGHARFNLINSVSAGVSNILLNVLLIPAYGLVGAAVASSLAASIRAAMEMTEMRYLLKVPVDLKSFIGPHIAALVVVGTLVLIGLTTALLSTTWLVRLGVLLGLLLLFALVMLVLPRPPVYENLEIRPGSSP